MEAKKSPSADITKKVGMFTNLGLAVALGLTLAAFEYKSYDDSSLKDLGAVTDNFEELLDVPISRARLLRRSDRMRIISFPPENMRLQIGA